MLRFYANRLLSVARELVMFEEFGTRGSIQWDNHSQIDLLKGLRENLRETDLKVSAEAATDLMTLFEEQVEDNKKRNSNVFPRWKRYLGMKPDVDSPLPATIDMHELVQRAATLRSTISIELRKTYPLVVPAKYKEFHEQKEPLFGKAVDEKIPEINEDVSEAGKCLALGRYTASVFHVMRALEIGVEKFGGILGVREPLIYRWSLTCS